MVVESNGMVSELRLSASEFVVANLIYSVPAGFNSGVGVAKKQSEVVLLFRCKHNECSLFFPMPARWTLLQSLLVVIRR